MACVCPMQGVSSSEGGQAERLAVIFLKAQEDYFEGGNSSQVVTAVMTHDSLASHIAGLKRLFLQKPRFLLQSEKIIKMSDQIAFVAQPIPDKAPVWGRSETSAKFHIISHLTQQA